MYPIQLRQAVRELTELLVAGRYADIESRTAGVRLPASEIESAISGYGKQLEMPPLELFENLDVVEVIDSEPKRWSVDVDLWTKEEGRSDLTMILTVIATSSDSFDLELDDIRVL